ncbi:MAG TPA: 2-dehydropantoate 2-reductase [Anaerohalosphaeraceae bacterium]|nr:2-dehydropantoate 2-reductase [Anaerohalosphaeraceae bacterium]HOL89906.1 2-dehydropantoate 2-reductase [Anaerohalosphaeraceae bacterium]HPP57147.1 2-dehydropantoate 2-reductase [Anaerohalosphaeraceae bacterium]
MTAKQQEFSVLLYGAGAVGLGIASCLLKAGTPTTLLARPHTAGPLRQEGLVRKGIFGEAFFPPSAFRVYESPEEISDIRYDFILVCTKSSDTLSAAKNLSVHSKLLTPSGLIVLFQNGWGNAEIFSDFFPKETIYNARVITGFIRPKPNVVEITVHADAVHIGSLFGESAEPPTPLCRAISAGGIPCQTTTQIGKDLWAKMLYNCALNPLGAVLDVPYGKLAEHPSTRHIMDRLIEETFDVMLADGYSTHWENAEKFKSAFYNQMVPSTAAHRSSTLQDLKAGKKTEIEALTGAVLRLAQKHRRAVPCSAFLYHLIAFIESRNNQNPRND